MGKRESISGGDSGGSRMRDSSRSHCQSSRKRNKGGIVVHVAETYGGIGPKGVVKMARHVREVKVIAPARTQEGSVQLPAHLLCSFHITGLTFGAGDRKVPALERPRKPSWYRPGLKCGSST